MIMIMPESVISECDSLEVITAVVATASPPLLSAGSAGSSLVVVVTTGISAGSSAARDDVVDSNKRRGRRVNCIFGLLILKKVLQGDCFVVLLLC